MADDAPHPSIPSTSPGGLYHERQRLFHCGVHSLNSLFQRPWIDAAALDLLAARVAAEQGSGDRLRSWMPRLGDYDLSVLVAALREGQGARFSRHLLANAALDAELAALRGALLRQQQGQEQGGLQEGGGNPALPPSPRIQGVLVNIRSRSPLNRWLWDGRHWLALVRSPSNGLWYDLDSKLPSPSPLGDVEAMLAYVHRCILEEDGQVFVVEVGENENEEDGQGS